MRKDFRTTRITSTKHIDRGQAERSAYEPGNSGLFHIYGRRPILEALKKGAVRAIEIAESAHGSVIDEIRGAAQEKDILVRRVSALNPPPDVADQGIMATALPPEVRGDLRAFVERSPADTRPLFLMLDGITDPHNFGAILRTADGAGVNAVVIRERRQAPVTDTVVKASAGAAYLVPIFHVTNLSQTVRMMKDAGFWIVAAVGEDSTSTAWRYDWRRPLVLIVGAEGHGVSDLLRREADDTVSIPMQGDIESLNVSVATGVLLFEAARQRQEPGDNR